MVSRFYPPSLHSWFDSRLNLTPRTTWEAQTATTTTTEDLGKVLLPTGGYGGHPSFFPLPALPRNQLQSQPCSSATAMTQALRSREKTHHLTQRNCANEPKWSEECDGISISLSVLVFPQTSHSIQPLLLYSLGQPKWAELCNSTGN